MECLPECLSSKALCWLAKSLRSDSGHFLRSFLRFLFLVGPRVLSGSLIGHRNNLHIKTLDVICILRKSVSSFTQRCWQEVKFPKHSIFILEWISNSTYAYKFGGSISFFLWIFCCLSPPSTPALPRSRRLPLKRVHGSKIN